MAVDQGSPTLDGAVFHDNEAAMDGGALALWEATASLSHVHMASNTAGNHGGAIYVWHGGCAVSQAILAGNTAVVDGGAIYTIESDLDVSHAVVYGNVGLGKIKACKYYDRDADGTQDAGEPAIEGWKMKLTGTDSAGTSDSRTVRATAT